MKVSKLLMVVSLASGVILAGCSNMQMSGKEVVGTGSVTVESTGDMQIGTIQPSAEVCKHYALSEYNAPLLSWMNSISTSKIAMEQQQPSFFGVIQLKGFEFKTQENEYFSVYMPYSGSVDGYTLNRAYNSGANMRSLYGTAVGDYREIISFEITEGNYDIKNKVNNTYECLVPSALNTNAQPWKGFMIYGPQLCNDNELCAGGSIPRYYITYPIAGDKTLVISTIDSSNVVVKAIMQKIFASLILK